MPIYEAPRAFTKATGLAPTPNNILAFLEDLALFKRLGEKDMDDLVQNVNEVLFFESGAMKDQSPLNKLLQKSKDHFYSDTFIKDMLLKHFYNVDPSSDHVAQFCDALDQKSSHHYSDLNA